MRAKDIVESSPLFKQFLQYHPQAKLTHFFAQIDAQAQLKSEWEVGYLSEEKITVFIAKDEEVTQKQADDVFKKPGSKVEPLKQEDVKTEFADIAPLAVQAIKTHFAKETLGDGFVILQTHQQQTVWNFSWIAKSLQFLNVKISAENKEVLSHDSFSVIEQ